MLPTCIIYIRNSRSLDLFERRLTLHFPSQIKMPWFSVGERFVNIHHTRICIGCSKLKAHLHFNLHAEDDPSCRCGFGIEDPYHFLFICPLYAQIIVMLDSISHIKPDIAPRVTIASSTEYICQYHKNKCTSWYGPVVLMLNYCFNKSWILQIFIFKECLCIIMIQHSSHCCIISLCAWHL